MRQLEVVRNGQVLMNSYKIPETHIFSSRDASSIQDVKSATHQRGVDVVLNCLAGELLQASCEVLAPLGRFVELGKHDIIANSNLGLKMFADGLTFSAVDLAVLRAKSRLVFDRTIGEALDLVFKYAGIHGRASIQESHDTEPSRCVS